MKSSILSKLLFFAVLLAGSTAFSQTTVSGVVSDATGPIPGVNVIERGTSNGTVTDFDGRYTLDNVSENGTLIFSFVGFASQQADVNGRTSIDITLQEDAAALEEVVVIGYGTQSVKDATGAVAVVSSEEFNEGAIISPEQLIQGKTAGVQITQNSGEPGAGISLRIRGTTSVRSNNNPLFVVDGVPLSGDETSAGSEDIGFGASSSQNPLNFLNPNDIESMSILKDASATAIYGSRGANGVVIITTKSGRAASKGKFEYSSNLSIANARNRYDLLDREQFIAARNQFFNEEQNAGIDFGGDTDWQDEVLRTAISSNQTFSYSKSYDDGNVRASFGYGKQFGVVQKSSLERIVGRINANHNFLDEKLKLSFQGTISRVNDENPPISNNAGFQGDLLGAAYSANPTWIAESSFNPGGTDINPLNLLANTLNESNTNRYLGNLSAEYFILPELSAKVSVGIDHSESLSIGVISANVNNITNGGVVGNGRGVLNEIDVENRLLEATLNYNKEFEDSKIEVLAGYSFQDFNRAGINVNAWGFSSENIQDMEADIETVNGQIRNSASGSFQQYAFTSVEDGLIIDDTRATGGVLNRLFPEIVRADPFMAPDNLSVRSATGDIFDFTDELQSFFVRGTYTLKDKYILTATVRADGSSRFGSDNRYGYFPSGAFAWKINEEDFIPESFSTLKLRLGFGITGTQDGLGFGSFLPRSRFAGIGINQSGEIVVPGAVQVAFENSELKWEETSQFNVGFDFGFMGDRLSGSIDIYRKNTQDLILQTATAQPSPTPFNFENLDASIINQGVEFVINYGLIEQENVNLDFGFNIAYNDNEVQDFDGLIPTGVLNGQGLTGSFVQLLGTDQPLFSYYLREFTGFENGVATYEGGANNIQYVDKSALPSVNLGTNINFRYKNLDASVFFAGQFGHYIYNATRNALFTLGSLQSARNVTEDVIDSGEGISNTPDPSTFFLEKGDFIRLQNASIGYNLPLSGEGLFDSVRISLNGQNLFVITDYSGPDPEVNTDAQSNGVPSAGIDYTAFPRPRTITAGINFTF